MNRGSVMTWVLVGAVCLLALGAVSAGVTAQDDGGNVTVEDEPNDDRANATPITNTGPGRNEFVGGSVFGRVNNTIDEETNTITDRDVDFFSFEATAGEAINVYSQASFYPPDYRGGFTPSTVMLYGPDGEVIDRIDTVSGDVFTAGGVAEETGTYYFRVNSSDSYDGSVAYDFGFEVADPDPFEPNDELDAATPIKPGERVEGALVDGERDVFAVEADAGENVTASVEVGDLPTDNPGNVAIDVLAPDGERLNEPTEDDVGRPANRTDLSGATVKDVATVSATVEEAGTYYLRVQGAYGSDPTIGIGGFVPYTLDADVSGGEPTNTIEITGTGPVVDYTFAAADVSPGERADIEDGTDRIDGGMVRGSTGEGGVDTYRFTGEIRGFEAETFETLVVRVNGERVDPASFGSVPGQATATSTPTATATPTPTATATPTPTPTTTATATPTATPTATATATTTATDTTTTATATATTTATDTTTVTTATTATANATPTTAEIGGEIVGGTETGETTSSGGPGFGIAGGVVAVLAAVALAGRRR